ncbi:MAG: glycosyltransferase family 2 protein [Candidatus Dormibacteria bacterium]
MLRRVRISDELLRVRRELEVLRTSPTVRVALGGRKILDVAAPAGTRRRTAARLAVCAALAARQGGLSGGLGVLTAARKRPGSVPLAVQYQSWRATHEPHPADLARWRQESRQWAFRPLVSVLLPTYRTERAWLRAAVESVRAQSYEEWELCICDDGSQDPSLREVLEEYAAADGRVRVTYRDHNGGISAASNDALGMARGAYVALLDHDDSLLPHALHRVVERLQVARDAVLIYSDEDLGAPDGTRHPGFFKPGWSPELLLSVNYICHLMVARTDAVRAAGGFRPGYDGGQDHDLALRLTDGEARVEHVADVLYTWRQVPGSTALASDAKMYAYEAGRRAVADALQRRGLDGVVTAGIQLGAYRRRLVLHAEPSVGIIVPTRDRLDLLRACVARIEQITTYARWQLVIVDNGSREPGTLEYLARTSHRVIHDDGEFNYSRLINRGRAALDADHLVTLNNDAMVDIPDWIEALLEHSQRPEVGVVGCRLMYPGGRVQHEGVALSGISGVAWPVNLDAGWLGGVIRDVSAVTGACQMTRTDVFDAVEGYDEELPVAYNDIDYCLRVRRAGWRVVYTPHAEVIHTESATRGDFHPTADAERFRSRWAGSDGRLHDDYLSPHLRHLNPLELSTS